MILTIDNLDGLEAVDYSAFLYAGSSVKIVPDPERAVALRWYGRVGP